MTGTSLLTNSWPLLRWFVSSATLTVPQAAGPVAFSFIALSLTGSTSGGAAMILAMTLAQIAGAVPLARLGRNLPAATTFRLLISFRAMALASITVCAAYGASFEWLVLFAAAAGLVNGAAYGFLRTLLNHFVLASRLPRALGIASTLNEVTFVLAPVAASGLATVSPLLALLAMTTLGALPAIVVPWTAAVARVEGLPTLHGKLLSPEVLLWFACAAASGATVASIEIGAVALALNFGYEPALAITFTVPLCLASVAGGIWISVRNRMASRTAVVVQLAAMALGSALAAVNHSMVMTVVGTVLIGVVLAPLGTYFSLALDTLAPPERRPELFALLRTSQAGGVVFASALLTFVSLSSALVWVTALMTAVTLAVALAPTRLNIQNRA
ncbi:MFS transporter [Neorhizobium galegae bv. officinalis]|nr:MFS transporter [Neorhizobium galegae bv. officinalis]CDZ42692.1 MFS transporter [Neorhizobium galegae bv. officinalis]